MKRKGIIFTQRRATFRESLSFYLQDWKLYLQAFSPSSGPSEFPKWQSETSDKEYVGEDDPRFGRAIMFVEVYEGQWGTVHVAQS